VNKKRLFHSTSIRLSAIYLTIVMSISVLFSIGLYRLSYQEIQRGYDRQRGPLQQIIISRGWNVSLEELKENQDQQLNEARVHLIERLVLVNLLILFFGGLLSYFLARNSLRPIEEIHEAQSRFTADASHELKTPITAMKLETELALTDPDLNLDDAKTQLKSNLEELDKLTNLSDSLLRLSRLENNELNLEKIEIDKIIREAIDKVKPLAVNKHQLISYKSETKGLQLSIDKPLILEAFVTILDNAVKYSPDKSKIEVRSDKRGNLLEISFIDKGVGISEPDLPRIFDRFYRADPSRNKNSAQGYGIGLSIAKSAIEAHNGKIDVASVINSGSTFTVKIPVK